MTTRAFRIGLLMLLALAVPAAASAQSVVDPPTDSACLQDLYRAFGREHRLARAVLFGKPSADDAPLTAVYYDAAGNAWAKIGDDEWQSPGAAFEEEDPISNDDMDDRLEKDLLCTNDNVDKILSSCVELPRRGIFEIRKTPTSDLVQPVVQTVRALQCRLRAICDLAGDSFGKKSGDTVTITNDGCLPMTFPVMNGCIDAESTIFNTLPLNCQKARQQLVEREMQLLTLTASYDAAYRSLAQFAGIFQEFLVQFRFPLIEPLWQMVRMLGGLNGIPCFQAECNE